MRRSPEVWSQASDNTLILGTGKGSMEVLKHTWYIMEVGKTISQNGRSKFELTSRRGVVSNDEYAHSGLSLNFLVYLYKLITIKILIELKLNCMMCGAENKGFR